VLEAAASRPGVELRPLLNALTLALAAVLVIVVGSVGIQRLRSSSAASAATPSPTIPPTLTPPLTPAPTLPAGQGWTPVGPPWAQSIVFASSAPRTAYICGTPANSDGSRQAPVALAISRDAGHTWQTTASAPTILATVCQVDVDPTDARDLLMQVEHCTACTTPLPAQLYRSVDGGQSWHLVMLPPLGDSSAATFPAYQWAWQGSALFVSPWVAGSAGVQSQNDLAISLAAGPFAWVNARALQAGVPPRLQLTTVYATSSAVYADFIGSDCTDDCEVVKLSADLGVTWSLFQPLYRGRPVYLFDQDASIADGRTLIGEVFASVDENTRFYVRSSDGGATWALLPSLPGNLIILSLASTPSGILYGEMWHPDATATPGVYRLAPRAGDWSLVGARPNGGYQQLVVSWDDQGAPVALWSGASVPQSAQIIAPGLATHTP
jgi:hypothetical protein